MQVVAAGESENSPTGQVVHGTTPEALNDPGSHRGTSREERDNNDGYIDKYW